MTTNYRIIISGGGTGGHIFPAIAIANAIKEAYPTADILFIGAQGRMEMEKVPVAGYPIKGLWISGFQRSLSVRNLLFPLKVLASLYTASRIINAFKPHVVVGVGGYASGPTLQMACRKKIPTVIQEQNSYPGITNKMLANKVNKICVAYPGMEKFFPVHKIVLTGNPVRQDITQLQGKKEEAYTYFGIDPSKKTLLVVGGSLGARSINESLLQGITALANSGFQVIWQTGKAYYPQIADRVAEFKKQSVFVYEFITKMDYAYALADVVISRAGAIAISELCLVKKPVILVPSPYVAEDHQTKNAMALVKENAALLVKDVQAKEQLVSTAIELMNNPQKQAELVKSIHTLGYEDAANQIRKEIIHLIENK